MYSRLLIHFFYLTSSCLLWRADSNYHLLVKSKAHPYKATPLATLMRLSKHYLLNLACFTVIHCNQILLQLCCFWFPFSSFTLSIKILLVGPYLFNLYIKAVHHPYIGTEYNRASDPGYAPFTATYRQRALAYSIFFYWARDGARTRNLLITNQLHNQSCSTGFCLLFSRSSWFTF